MIQKLREKGKNKKGFTLVELIVVLVILAILIAMLVPSLTGYIDKAQDKKVLAEAKLALNAAQTVVGEGYASKELKVTTITANKDAKADTDTAADTAAKEFYILSEMKGNATAKADFENGKIKLLTYTDGEKKVTYENGKWGEVVKGNDVTDKKEQK